MPQYKSGDEIERVFKVRQIPKDIEKYPSENVVQGYLAIDVTGAEGRLRKVAERYFETYKGCGRLQRRELEIELSHDQFNTLWPGIDGRRIEKIRYQIDGPRLPSLTAATAFRIGTLNIFSTRPSWAPGLLKRNGSSFTWKRPHARPRLILPGRSLTRLMKPHCELLSKEF
jgi:hypothetical protein